MVDFNEVVNNLIDVGFYDVILPFLLVYAIIFAILQKSQIFEGGSTSKTQARNVNSVVALVFGLFVVLSYNVVQYIQIFFINVVVIITFLLGLFIVLGFILGDKLKELLTGTASTGIAIVVTIVVLALMLYILGFWTWFANWWDGISLGDSDTLTTVIVLGVIGLILYWISRGGDDSSNKKDN